MVNTENKFRLTQFSPGAGCGCKIAPSVLERIIGSNTSGFTDPRLLVGNESKDDAAVYDLGNGQAVISTTDFFMPITDDPYEFGRIASANAISDVYAMGGKPLMAISILGWPLEKLPEEMASRVLEGSREVCRSAGITLAGGHSIDSLEPIFGLAVTGLVDIANIKRNDTARAGCKLYLGKSLGVGIITTAEKRGIASEEHVRMALEQMTRLNSEGYIMGHNKAVTAMTDVTGFGLLGHLLEMCEGSNLNAELYFDRVPVIPGINAYISQGAIPGGTFRNWQSYGMKVTGIDEYRKMILCDPQTSGGLMLAIDEQYMSDSDSIADLSGFSLVGRLVPATGVFLG